MDRRVRVYESALNGVSYVYGEPVKFIARPGVCKRRERDRRRRIEHLELLAAQREEAERKRRAKD